MITIKTTCTRCGAIKLTGYDVSLQLRPNGREGHYRFTCPTCAQSRLRPANARVVNVLLAIGVSVEIDDPDPITELEIMTFVAALEAEPDPFRLLAG